MLAYSCTCLASWGTSFNYKKKSKNPLPHLLRERTREKKKRSLNDNCLTSILDDDIDPQKHRQSRSSTTNQTHTHSLSLMTDEATSSSTIDRCRRPLFISSSLVMADTFETLSDLASLWRGFKPWHKPILSCLRHVRPTIYCVQHVWPLTRVWTRIDRARHVSCTNL